MPSIQLKHKNNLCGAFKEHYIAAESVQMKEARLKKVAKNKTIERLLESPQHIGYWLLYLIIPSMKMFQNL